MDIAKSGAELINICSKEHISLSEYAIRQEIELNECSRDELISKMKETLDVMKTSSSLGREKEIYSISGLIGGDAYRLQKYHDSGKSLMGSSLIKAMARAISSSEVNSSMGKIVACPTAGSCGILPAALLTAGEILHKSDDELISALFAASSVGILIGKNATFSGAEGGCQAECGSASAMACSAVIEMMGGTPKMSLDGAAIIFKNILGLVCDPVAGLVEIPCAKRNVSGTINALCTADLVMAGIESKIPFDDALAAMYRVGKSLPEELRETALGGIAITDTGKKLKEEIIHKI